MSTLQAVAAGKVVMSLPCCSKRPRPVLHSTIRAVWPDWPIIQEQSRLPDTLSCGREIPCGHSLIVGCVKVKAKFRANHRSLGSPRARENDLNAQRRRTARERSGYFSGEKF